MLSGPRMSRSTLPGSTCSPVRALRLLLVWTPRQQEQQAFAAQPPQREPQSVPRRTVEPLLVIDRQQKRRSLGNALESVRTATPSAR